MACSEREEQGICLPSRSALGTAAFVNWIVSISEEERKRRMLSPVSFGRAVQALNESGVLLLRGIFDRARIQEMHAEYVSKFGDLDAARMRERSKAPRPNRFLCVGEQRYELTLDVTGRLGDPAVFASELLQLILRPALGARIQIGSYTTVVSHPGAEIQHIHRDGGALFPDQDLGPTLPPYAINVAIPLIDVSLDIGPTGFWPGSHRWKRDVQPDPAAIVVEPLMQGDCLLLDYRTFHAGLPNNSTTIRPILYVVYARPWYFDDGNHKGRRPVNISLEEYSALPERLRDLLMRGYVQAMRAADNQPLADKGAEPSG